MSEEPGPSTDLSTFMDFVMPICPPPNNLHLLCDVNLAGKYVTCEERAVIVEYCLDLFGGIYVKSRWERCKLAGNFCEDTVNILKVKGYIRTDIPESTTDTSITTDTSGLGVTSSWTQSRHITTETLQTTSYQFNITSVVIATNNRVTMENKLTSTPSITGTEGDVVTSGVNVTAHPVTEKEDEALSTSYVYPIIGVIIVLIEIAILFFIYFYLKKRQRSPPYRHPSKESLHEEMIAPETTSPTQAFMNHVEYEEDDIFKQDQKIYQSYLNLRYIDDSSVEATPEKVIIK